LIKIHKLGAKLENKILLDLSFEFEDSLALVGESGSGKSLALKTIMGLLPGIFECEAKIEAPFELIRGKSVAFVPQNAFTTLSPMSKIGKQFWGIDKYSATQMIEAVGLTAEIFDRFPSELSGGQLQRVVLAIALSCKPQLLLLDEPTTALDEDNKAIVLSLIKNLQRELGFSMIFVTHEIGLAQDFCESVLVIKNGQKVEQAQTIQLMKNPKSEYAKTLLEANFKNRAFRQ
jgi:peptide/nickel transport system ATP-binding protein